MFNMCFVPKWISDPLKACIYFWEICPHLQCCLKAETVSASSSSSTVRRKSESVGKQSTSTIETGTSPLHLQMCSFNFVLDIVTAFPCRIRYKALSTLKMSVIHSSLWCRNNFTLSRSSNSRVRTFLCDNQRTSVWKSSFLCSLPISPHRALKRRVQWFAFYLIHYFYRLVQYSFEALGHFFHSQLFSVNTTVSCLCANVPWVPSVFQSL